MNDLKKSITENAFNEDKMLADLYQRADHAHLRSQWGKHPKEPYMKKKGIIFACISLALILGLYLIKPGSLINSPQVVAAYVSVDINPSFQLSSDDDGYVIAISALNDDAKTIDVSDLVGMSVEAAIDAIVERAAAAGFIDITDLEDDYVVVTTVATDAASSGLTDTLYERLAARVQNSGVLQSINLVEMTATQSENAAAADADTPLGIWLLNQTLGNNGEMLSVKQCFADGSNLEAIQTRAQITAVSEDQLRERIQTALTAMQADGIDTTELQERLANAGADSLLQIQNEVKQELAGMQDNGNSDQETNGQNGTDNGTDTNGTDNNNSGSDNTNGGTDNGSGGNDTNGGSDQGNGSGSGDQSQSGKNA